MKERSTIRSEPARSMHCAIPVNYLIQNALSLWIVLGIVYLYNSLGFVYCTPLLLANICLHCRRPSLSQRVTELAQRVDFTEVAEGQDGEPAVKKATQKWPWEQVHSKLK